MKNLLALIYCATLSVLVGNPPNFLLITADDLGVELGSYGDYKAVTPEMDALAAGGVRFTRGYVTQASCSSSRSSIFTGLYPHQNGQIGLAHVYPEFSLPPGLATLPKALKTAGYFTGVYGKIHVNSEGDLPFDFNESRHPSFHSRDVRAAAEVARSFWEECGDRPFFLMFNLFDPHRKRSEMVDQADGLPGNPRQAHDMDPFPFQEVTSPDLMKDVAGYYNSVERLDAGIGLLLKELEEAGHLENTMIFLIGDHGAPFNRAKGSSYEAGIRIPFLVSWAAQIEPGVRNEMVSTIDIFPTILEAAGLEIPGGLEGRSLMAILEGIATPWREYLFTEFTLHGRGQLSPRRTIRNNRFKLIHNLLPGRPNGVFPIDGCSSYEASRDPEYHNNPIQEVFDRFRHPPEFELYNLQLDPYEMVNLAGHSVYLGVLEDLTATLLAWRRETGDPLLDPDALDQLVREYSPGAANP
jgi:N-sulfoglucosamine sulfohydrolase